MLSLTREFRRFRRGVRFVLRHPLARRHRAAALKRYVLFHVTHMLLPRPRVYPWVGPLELIAYRGGGPDPANIYTGLPDLEVMSFLVHFLRAGDLFVDVGANAGTYSLLASGICGAKSIAVEPVPSTFSDLQANVSLNNLRHLVTCINAAVGSSAGQLRVTSRLGSMNRVLLDGETTGDEGVWVEAVRLDDLLDGQFPAAIKIDTEGYEFQVLAGASRSLACQSCHAVVVETLFGARYGHCDSELHAILANHGFAPSAYDPFTRRVHQPSGPLGFNWLYLRDLEAISARIADAPPLRVLNVAL